MRLENFLVCGFARGLLGAWGERSKGRRNFFDGRVRVEVGIGIDVDVDF